MAINRFYQTTQPDAQAGAYDAVTYDTKKLKAMYYQFSSEGEWMGKIAIMGALTLYLDFINIFMHLLNLFGEKKR